MTCFLSLQNFQQLLGMASSCLIEPVMTIIVPTACSTCTEASNPSTSRIFRKLEDSSSTMTHKCLTQLSNSVVSSLSSFFFWPLSPLLQAPSPSWLIEIPQAWARRCLSSKNNQIALSSCQMFHRHWCPAPEPPTPFGGELLWVYAFHGVASCQAQADLCRIRRTTYFQFLRTYVCVSQDWSKRAALSRRSRSPHYIVDKNFWLNWYVKCSLKVLRLISRLTFVNVHPLLQLSKFFLSSWQMAAASLLALYACWRKNPPHLLFETRYL